MQTATPTRPTPLPGSPAPAPDSARRNGQPAGQAAAVPRRGPLFVLYPEDGITTLLLIAIMPFITIASIVAFLNSSVPGLQILLLITLLGLLYGVLAVQQRVLPGVVVHILAVILGGAVAFQRTANAVLDTNYRLLLVHLGIWLNHVRHNQVSDDNIVFLLFVAFLSFLLAYLSVWLVVHSRRPWLAVLANGVVLLINLNYAPPDDLVFLLVFLLDALLLLMRFTLADNMRQWRARRLRFSPDLTWDFTQLGAFFCVIVLILAYVLPVGAQNAAINDFFANPSSAWQAVQREFQSLFGGLTGPGGGGFGFFSQNLQLQGNIDLPNTEVLRYTGQDPQEYLITQTYDTYDGTALWTQSLTQTQSYPANATLPPSSTDTRLSNLTVFLTNIGSGGHSIFANGEPASFSVPVDVYVTAPGVIPTSWHSQRDLVAGQTYTALSYLSLATPDQLRAVPYPASAPNGTYPPDVLNDYLTNTNTTISPEVAATGKQWATAAGAQTPYDAAVAIESQLQTSFTFSFHNGTVPPNQDAVVWFLHNKKGFCTFFASAMALMMRSLGMPARIAEGFNNGHYDSRQHNYVVKGTDAHVWTQVYFPGYGWINFEPTASFPLFQRGSPTGVTPGVTPSVGGGTPGGRRTPTPRFPTETPIPGGPPQPAISALRDVGIALLFLVALALLVAGGFLAWWRASYRGLSPGAGAFARIVRLGDWLGSRPARAQTPYEYADQLGRVVPEERGSIRRLAELYVRERWGGIAAAGGEVAALYQRARAALARALARRLSGVPGQFLARLLTPLRPLVELVRRLGRWLGRLLDSLLQPRAGG